MIEFSTFRAYLDAAAAEAVSGNERTSKSELAGMKHADFWMEVKRLAKVEDADEILVYMHMMLDRARAAGSATS